MSVVEVNPVDGLPEWKGRQIVTPRQKARAEKRGRRFVLASWDLLVPAMHAMGCSRAQRLFFTLLLHRKLQRVQAQGGWVLIKLTDLKAVGLADSNFTKAVAHLEKLGLIEVQRRPGKRPLLRLIDGGSK
jgi:hypothetical protein